MKRQKIKNKLRPVRITYRDGTILNTAINGSDLQIHQYYAVGKVFNIGDGPWDNLQGVEKCEILD